MSLLLRIDGYALAQPNGAEWRTEWCIARRDGRDGWRFGGEAGESLQPKRTDGENNEYFETLSPERIRGTSDADLAYLQLKAFLPEGGGEIDLSVNAGTDQPRLECLLGILEALGCTPRGIFPTALLAARELAPGRYGIVELGRNRSWVSLLEVRPDQVRLESVREYGEFGFYPLFTQWLEHAAEAFAAQHRFDIHRNLAANREQLFEQMRQAFAKRSGQVQLNLNSQPVTLDEKAFQARWPEPASDMGELELLLLPPLAQALPLPQQGLGLSCCANPAPQALSDLTAALPEDGQAHRCMALSC